MIGASMAQCMSMERITFMFKKKKKLVIYEDIRKLFNQYIKNSRYKGIHPREKPKQHGGGPRNG